MAQEVDDSTRGILFLRILYALDFRHELCDDQHNNVERQSIDGPSARGLLNRKNGQTLAAMRSPKSNES